MLGGQGVRGRLPPAPYRVKYIHGRCMGVEKRYGTGRLAVRGRGSAPLAPPARGTQMGSLNIGVRYCSSGEDEMGHSCTVLLATEAPLAGSLGLSK